MIGELAGTARLVGVAESAANIDSSWITTDADALFTTASGQPVHVINDADAAGVAELRYGVATSRKGEVLMLTFGTGIGSGLFVDGTLVPNTELGHLELDGVDAESGVSAAARDREDLSWRSGRDASTATSITSRRCSTTPFSSAAGL